MQISQWMTSLFLATALCAAPAMAADAKPASAPAQEAALDKIMSSPAAAERDKKDCPVNHAKKECKHDNKECMHKNGEPCPYHGEDNHHGKLHKKCDYKPKS